MESATIRSTARPGWLSRRSVDLDAVRTWVLCAALVLYLGFTGGGYAVTTYAQVGIVVWWIVVICCAWGLLPATALSRAALVAVLAFGAFTAWTALGITWSISAGRSFQDLALITSYLGIFTLAVAIHRDRQTAMRHSVTAVAVAIVCICAVSLTTRLAPGFIPSARNFQDANNRLSWPLDYWNALADLAVLAIPLLLSIAVSARRLIGGALAAAAIPVVVLCGALTQSRGGLITAAVAILIWLALAPERVPKLATGAVVAAGSAAAVAGGFHAQTIKLAEVGALEHHQAARLSTALLLICAGVGVAQLGIGLLLRHATPPSAIAPPRRVAVALSVAATGVLVLVALAIGVPHKLSHVWSDFKNPVNQSAAGSHFAATSGEGRYQYWVAAAHSAHGHTLIGSGPGTYQLDWLPRAHIYSYVTNAHNLYVETYAELGWVGVGLLGLFIAVTLMACLRAVVHSAGPDRTRAAAITAAVTAFFVGASFDWLWQVPVLVACVLLLGASVLAPSARGTVGRAVSSERAERRGRRAAGVSASLLGLAGLVAIAYPLSVTAAITDSQRAAATGQAALALRDARQAVSIESGSAAAQIQLAVTLEQRGDVAAALRAGEAAVRDEPDNWTGWLTLSRLQAEDGHAQAAVAAYRRARSLNPESSLFHP